MKKLIVLVAMLMLASMAFAQLSYVGADYTGSNAPRLTQDSKLGPHDVMASPNAFQDWKDANGNAAVAERNGCQSCHIPHGSQYADAYLWRYTIPNYVELNGFKQQTGKDANNQPIYATPEITDPALFHTLACLSCHDGKTATDVVTNLGGTFPSYATFKDGDLSHEHPVHQMLTQRSSAVNYKNVRFYTPAGVTLTQTAKDVNGNPTSGYQYGYVECGSCHDPHKGDGGTYAFLRSATGVAATPQYARLDLCRSCHGK